MAVTWEAFGTSGSGTATAIPGLPAGLVANWLLLAHCGTAEASETQPTISSGWTLLDTVSGGPGSFGVDDGPRRSTVWYRIADGSETDPTMTVAGSASGRAISGRVIGLSKTLGRWVIGSTTGTDTSSGTGYSAAGGADPGGVADGIGITLSCIRPDTATTSTSPTLTWTGTGVSTLTGRYSDAKTDGNDMRLDGKSRATTGTSTGSPTYAVTLSAAGGGATVFVSVYDVDASPVVRAFPHLNRGLIMRSRSIR